MSGMKKLEYNGTGPETWKEYLVYKLNRCMMVGSTWNYRVVLLTEKEMSLFHQEKTNHCTCGMPFI